MAKNGKFRCTRCGRVFAMAMHLGRHMKTVHGPKVKRTAPAARKWPAAAARPSAFDGRTRLLGELNACRGELAAQRAAIDAQVAALDQVMATLGAPAAKPKARTKVGRKAGTRVRRPRRPRRTAREGSLRSYVEEVLRTQRGPLTVKEVTTAVLKAGYKSRNKELPKTIGKFLRAMPGVARVERGVFRVK